MKKKVEIVVLGGSGLIGKAIINELLSKNKKILNLDLINKENINNNYFFDKFDMTEKNLEKKLNNIFKNYHIPQVFIDCSYILTLKIYLY
mgnify:FL=1